MTERGAQITLVRGIAETLPFRDGVFDRVLCHSAIDHVAAPDVAAREMARVLAPTADWCSARSTTAAPARASAGRCMPPAAAWASCRATRHLFWDTPVPVEHTFECTYERLQRLCGPYFEFDHAFGVSLGWGLPGWGAVLERMPRRRRAAPAARARPLGMRVPAPSPTSCIRSGVRARRRPGGCRSPPRRAASPCNRTTSCIRTAPRAEAWYWRFADFRGSFVRPGVDRRTHRQPGVHGRSEPLVARRSHRARSRSARRPCSAATRTSTRRSGWRRAAANGSTSTSSARR